MSTVLPEDFTYGRLEGKFFDVIADSSDPDSEPEKVPATGTIKIVPNAPILKTGGTALVKATFIPKAHTCTIDSEGDLVDEMGNKGITLVSTDLPFAAPSDWTYSAIFSINGAQIGTASFRLPAGATLNFADIIEVPASGGVVTIVSNEVYLQTVAVRDEVVALADSFVVDASVDEFGNLLLERNNGTTTNLGMVGGEGDSVSVGGAQPASGWWLDTGASPLTVTPDAPIFTDADGTASDTYTIPTTENVQYLVDGSVVAAGTYPAVGTVVVTAEALNGYTLDGYPSGGWSFTFSSGTVDVTAPTAGSLVASSVTASGFTLTVTGASDAIGLHAQPYAFSTDGGSTWTPWQASAVYVATGAEATTYSCQHKVRDAALNEATGTPINVTTTSTTSLAYLQTASSGAEAGPYTFAAQNLGEPDPTRSIIVAVGSRPASSGTVVSSVTVGGVSAVLDHDWISTDSTWIYRAEVPLGTSGDVVVTFSGADVRRCLIALYRFAGGALSVNNVGGGTNGGVITGTGLVIAASTRYQVSVPVVAWADATKDSEGAVENVVLTTAHTDVVGPLAISAKYNGSSGLVAAVAYTVS